MTIRHHAAGLAAAAHASHARQQGLTAGARLRRQRARHAEHRHAAAQLFIAATALMDINGEAPIQQKTRQRSAAMAMTTTATAK